MIGLGKLEIDLSHGFFNLDYYLFFCSDDINFSLSSDSYRMEDGRRTTLRRFSSRCNIS